MKRLKSVLAVAFVACGIGAASAPAASAAHGDWWTQYNITRNDAQSYCSSIGAPWKCWGIEYVDLSAVSSNSRRGIWRITYVNGYNADFVSCYYYNYIGNNYYIWQRQLGHCWTP